MMFIDDIDEDQLSIQAWAFVDKHGWIGQIEAPYQVRDALYKGFYAGYEQARKDEKQMYDEAIKLIQESQNRGHDPNLYLATGYFPHQRGAVWRRLLHMWLLHPQGHGRESLAALQAHPQQR